MVWSECLDLPALTSCHNHRFLTVSEATPDHKLLLWRELVLTESAERSRQEIAQVYLVQKYVAQIWRSDSVVKDQMQQM